MPNQRASFLISDYTRTIIFYRLGHSCGKTSTFVGVRQCTRGTYETSSVIIGFQYERAVTVTKNDNERNDRRNRGLLTPKGYIYYRNVAVRGLAVLFSGYTSRGTRHQSYSYNNNNNNPLSG